MAHTSGKWEVEDGTQVVSGTRLVANTGGYTTNYCETRTENVANANLISAAPDMYEALKAFDAYLQSSPLKNENMKLKKIAVDLMDKAIIKAEGKS